MDHAALVEALKDPGSYPHPVVSIEYLQTHISSVFLTGEVAYKLKKPVNFGFLDFSTVELRRRFCEAEVTLNRRLAPSVYRGVAPITVAGGRTAVDGSGDVVDWLVVMRQMDTARLGLEVLGRGELDDHHIDQIVDQLVPFYRNAATGPGIDEYGRVDAVRFNTDENFAQTEAYVGSALSARRRDAIRDFTDSFLERERDLFERRVAHGFIRESHGDLHLGNICFEAEPVIFDCIEFNERFRCGDIAVDLAFLAMDLDFRGRPELAQRLIDGYVARSGDRDLPRLIDFYRCYRAYVRGKVSCFSASDRGLPDAAKHEQLDLARRYFNLAHRYAGGAPRPVLLVIYGLMGTGKTSLAAHLEQTHGWHLISSDAVRKHLAGVGETTRVWVPYNVGIYSPEMNRRTYSEMCRRACSLLTADLPVVMDGCFKAQAERLEVVEAAARVGADVLFVQTTCDAGEQRRRLESRQETDTRSDGRVELMESQCREFEPPTPEHARLHRELATGTSLNEARANLEKLLQEKGLLV